MYIDIVFPSNNEEKFIKNAILLGYNGLILTYKFNKKNVELFHKVKKIYKLNNFKIKLFLGLMINPKQINKTKKIADIIVTEADINKINISKNTLMYNFENITIKDKFNQKTSGLNHILCKSLKKKNIPIIFPITTFFNSKNQQKLFGKILQNIKLCKKYKNIIILTSFAKHPKEMISPHDLIAYGIILGLTPTQAKKSIFNIHNLILLNKKKKTGKLITEGVELLD